MAQPDASGSIDARRDIIAHTINTGHVQNETNLTVNVIVNQIEQLAEVLSKSDSAVRISSSGGREAVSKQQAVLSLPDNVLHAFRLLPRATDAPMTARRQAYAAWVVTHEPVAPTQEVAARDRYIPLAGWVSSQDLPLTLQFTERRWSGEGPQRQLERIPLSDVSQAVAEHPAFVLLGPPGGGKSTVLRRLAFDAARACLTGSDDRLPLRINLASYKGEQATPLDFVSQLWGQEGLPGDFISQVRAGAVLLLADGFNEMERLAAEGDRRRRANAWQEFIQQYFSDRKNQSRAIIASREGDYDQPLGLPRVEIEVLSDGHITAFLEAYLGNEAEAAQATLRRLDLQNHARNPYQLAVLAALYDSLGEALPSNRGRLFAEYAHELLKREEAVNHPHWIRLDVQLAALSQLGYEMQVESESTVLSRERLVEMLPSSVTLNGESIELHRRELFDLACRAGLFVSETELGYKFSHQLLQEQFAAQHLLALWQAGTGEESRWWWTPRTSYEMPPADSGWEPLPVPPPTGWEETTILAAGLTDQPDAFVQAVRAVNASLAGRCIDEGRAQVSPATLVEVQQALLADLEDESCHRRARLQAGRVLAQVGDPRFVPQLVQGVTVIAPQLVRVSGGTATIGSRRWPWDRQADADERPRHRVTVDEFYLARFPVTHAEYDCFIQAGGYDVEQYWTSEGWKWRQGEGDVSGPVEGLLEGYRYLRQNPDEIEKRLRDGRFTPDAASRWASWVKEPEEEFRQQVLRQYPIEPHDHPFFWDDPSYNASNLPVVGVTWYEAMAYCSWLQERLTNDQLELNLEESTATDRLHCGAWEVRLPTEVEWEWAAGGDQHRRYPWGRTFDSDRANTLEGRVMGTSPVGAFPSGCTPSGALDMCGNVWEWCHSLYQPYPYRVQDGRENPLAEGHRTLRGGAWSDNARHARVSSRSRDHPAFFNDFIGFRVVLAPALSSVPGF